MPSIILSDNGVSSGSAGLKSTAASDGALALQTTTAGGSATTAALIDTSQNVLIGMASYGVTNAGVSLSPTASSSFYVAGGTAVTIGRGVSNGTAVQFNRSGTNVGTIDVATTGLTMTGTNGITFTAAQSASSDANTLDDYEEGSWTPTLEFGGASVGISYTGSGRSGRYTKVGNLVTVSCFIELSSKGSSTGTARISGMPFTVRQLSAAWGLSGGGSGLAWGSMGVNLVYSQSAPIPNTANTLLLGITAGTTVIPALTDASFSNSGYVGFTMTYEVA